MDLPPRPIYSGLLTLLSDQRAENGDGGVSPSTQFWDRIGVANGP